MNIIQMARDAGLWCPSGEPESGNWYGCYEELEAFAAISATAEREACANWLRRNANAEKDPAKRAAFTEAHNAILARSNDRVQAGEASPATTG